VRGFLDNKKRHGAPKVNVRDDEILIQESIPNLNSGLSVRSKLQLGTICPA
jgi:hypothetical protein